MGAELLEGVIMRRMGRKRETNLHLPPHMRMRKGRFYYDTQAKPRREIPLGGDYAAALVKWAEHEGRGKILPANVQPTFAMAWQRYRTDVLPGKAPRTQSDNLEEAENLLGVFKDAPLGQIKPTHVRGYLDARGKVAKVRANREKALLSHVFNMARAWGYTEAPNPCAGIKGFREDGRDKYVEEAEFRAVYAQACIPVRNAMDLAYLTGQRPADPPAARRAEQGAARMTEAHYRWRVNDTTSPWRKKSGWRVLTWSMTEAQMAEWALNNGVERFEKVEGAEELREGEAGGMGHLAVPPEG